MLSHTTVPPEMEGPPISTPETPHHVARRAVRVVGAEDPLLETLAAGLERELRDIPRDTVVMAWRGALGACHARSGRNIVRAPRAGGPRTHTSRPVELEQLGTLTVAEHEAALLGAMRESAGTTDPSTDSAFHTVFPAMALVIVTLYSTAEQHVHTVPLAGWMTWGVTLTVLTLGFAALLQMSLSRPVASPARAWLGLPDVGTPHWQAALWREVAWAVTAVTLGLLTLGATAAWQLTTPELGHVTVRVITAALALGIMAAVPAHFVHRHRRELAGHAAWTEALTALTPPHITHPPEA